MALYEISGAAVITPSPPARAPFHCLWGCVLLRAMLWAPPMVLHCCWVLLSSGGFWYGQDCAHCSRPPQHPGLATKSLATAPASLCFFILSSLLSVVLSSLTKQGASRDVLPAHLSLWHVVNRAHSGEPCDGDTDVTPVGTASQHVAGVMRSKG